MSDENKEKYTLFEVGIESKFIPGEGRKLDKFREAIFTVYARDINEAITMAKELINLNSEDIEVVSAGMPSRGYPNRR